MAHRVLPVFPEAAFARSFKPADRLMISGLERIELKASL
jgi:hypothetical protein